VNLVTESLPQTACSPALETVLTSFEEVCREALELSLDERRALSQSNDYASCLFDQARKDLMPRLGQCLMSLRNWRQLAGESTRDVLLAQGKVRDAVEAIENLVAKYLLAHSELQKALLERVFDPGRQSVEPMRPKHWVSDVYRRSDRG
jgi:hypothetical protein